VNEITNIEEGLLTIENSQLTNRITERTRVRRNISLIVALQPGS